MRLRTLGRTNGDFHEDARRTRGRQAYIRTGLAATAYMVERGRTSRTFHGRSRLRRLNLPRRAAESSRPRRRRLFLLLLLLLLIILLLHVVDSPNGRSPSRSPTLRALFSRAGIIRGGGNCAQTQMENTSSSFFPFLLQSRFSEYREEDPARARLRTENVFYDASKCKRRCFPAENDKGGVILENLSRTAIIIGPERTRVLIASQNSGHSVGEALPEMIIPYLIVEGRNDLRLV